MSKKLTKTSIANLAFKRNHILVTSNFEKTYENIKSLLLFKCRICQTEFRCTVHSYKNAKKTGCPGCKKRTLSKLHKGKILTEKTRTLIGQKASKRSGSLKNKFGENHPAFKGGYGRDKKTRSTVDYCWINEVKKRCNYKCVLTGSKINLKCHHLNSWNSCIEERYEL
jgi:hypothetical protein